MTTEPEEPIAKLTRPPRKVVVSMVAGLAILIGLPVALILLNRQIFPVDDQSESAASAQLDGPDHSTGDSPSRPSVPAGDVPEHGAGVTESEPETESLSLQQEALQHAKLLRVRNQGNRVRKQWEALSLAQNQLTLSLRSLLSDDAGRRISSSSELVDQFTALQETAIPAAQVTEELQAELEIMLKPLDAIQVLQVASDFTAALDDLVARIDGQLLAVKRDQRMLDALQAAAARRDPVDTSLKDAVAKRETELAQNRIAAIAKAAVDAREDAIERFSNASAEQQRKIAEAEREVERLKEQQRLDELEATKAARQAAIAKAALEREFQRDLPQIRSLLRPLITEGMTQPGRTNFEPADKKGPVSLAKLRGTGALAPTAKARAGLYYIVGTIRDRDLGSFPSYRGGAQDVQSHQATMMRVQELVNKYGELMVEKGLLAE